MEFAITLVLVGLIIYPAIWSKRPERQEAAMRVFIEIMKISQS
jgi:hypothetical protein